MSSKSPSTVNNSSQFLISPSTEAWISQITKMPSPNKTLKCYTKNQLSPKKLIAKNNFLREKLINIKRLLKEKRTIITYMVLI